jgi:hypothetical protein
MMRIEEIRNLCEPEFSQERNKELCLKIQYIDEGGIFRIDRDIFAKNYRLNPVECLDVALEKIKSNDGDFKKRFSSNFWPGDKMFSRDFSRSIVICRGKCSLDRAFTTIMRHSDKICVMNHHPKTIFLLSDKWNNETFKRYEKRLLEYTLSHNVWYIFLLVTMYGYTQIPFLPNDREKIQNLRYEEIEEDY